MRGSQRETTRQACAGKYFTREQVTYNQTKITTTEPNIAPKSGPDENDGEAQPQ